MASFDVIIVGGGPAGSGAAIRLAQLKRSVLLLEKAFFPRDKVCGDGLSGKTVGLLRELGLEKAVEPLSSPRISGVSISAPNGVPMVIPMSGENYGYCCRREVLDNVLFQKAKSLVETREEFLVLDVIKENDVVVGVKGKDLKSGKEASFFAKVVIGADGANSVISSKVGNSSNPPEHHIVALRGYYENVKGLTDTIEIHFIQDVLPGYFWIFPLEKPGFANVGVGMITKDVNRKKRDLRKSMEQTILENPLFKERFAVAKRVNNITGWGLPLGSFARKSSGDGWILLGDAASLIDPFTGEGIGNALLSGKLAVEVIEKALQENDVSALALSEYSKRVEEVLRPELKTSFQLQRLANHPWLLNFVVNKAKKKPQIAQFLGESLVNEKPREKLASPLSVIKLFFL